MFHRYLVTVKVHRLVTRSVCSAAHRGSPQIDRTFMFPQRVGPTKYSAYRNLRMRYLLKNPRCMAGERELMHAVTEHVGFGVEFVERVIFSRVLVLSLGLSTLAFVIGIAYGFRTGDWPNAFGIACMSHLLSSLAETD